MSADKRLWAVVIFNFLQYIIALLPLSAARATMASIVGIPLMLLSYFLLRGGKGSYRTMTVWLLLQTISFNFPFFSLSLRYGYFLDLHVMNSPIGFNPIGALMLVLLLLAGPRAPEVQGTTAT